MGKAGLMPRWLAKGQNTAFIWASRRCSRTEKRRQERKFSPCCNTRSQAFGFHLFRQRRTADIIKVQLLAVFRFEQPLQAVQVVSVLLLLRGI
ncbi:Uncharacterised protein [Salmonella bongori]|nr:Uncharacterised protein [Salmonella bongori]